MRYWGDRYSNGVRCLLCDRELDELADDPLVAQGIGTADDPKLDMEVREHRNNNDCIRFQNNEHLQLIEMERVRLEKEEREVELSDMYFYDYHDEEVIHESNAKHVQVRGNAADGYAARQHYPIEPGMPIRQPSLKTQKIIQQGQRGYIYNSVIYDDAEKGHNPMLDPLDPADFDRPSPRDEDLVGSKHEDEMSLLRQRRRLDDLGLKVDKETYGGAEADLAATRRPISRRTPTARRIWTRTATTTSAILPSSGTTMTHFSRAQVQSEAGDPRRRSRGSAAVAEDHARQSGASAQVDASLQGAGGGRGGARACGGRAGPPSEGAPRVGAVRRGTARVRDEKLAAQIRSRDDLFDEKLVLESKHRRSTSGTSRCCRRSSAPRRSSIAPRPRWTMGRSVSRPSEESSRRRGGLELVNHMKRGEISFTPYGKGATIYFRAKDATGTRDMMLLELQWGQRHETAAPVPMRMRGARAPRAARAELSAAGLRGGVDRDDDDDDDGHGDGEDRGAPAPRAFGAAPPRGWPSGTTPAPRVASPLRR